LAICRAHEIEHLAISLLFPPPLSPKEPPYLTSCLTPTPSFWLQNKLNEFISHVLGPLQINNNKTNKVLDSKYLARELGRYYPVQLSFAHPSPLPKIRPRKNKHSLSS